MKTINTYITERLKLSNKTSYKYHPKDENELEDILKERLAKDKNANLNDIDVSNVENMDYLFVKLDPHNIHIEYWDVSNCRTMSDMFRGCKNFNCYLGNWNVENVIRMFNMFDGCEKFKGEGLDNWKLTNCTYLNRLRMFDNCNSMKNMPGWYK